MALRSRCAEIFFEPLIPSDRTYCPTSGKETRSRAEKGAEAIIAEYTIEGRKPQNLADGEYSLFKRRENRGTLTEPVQITKDDVRSKCETHTSNID